jgi:hypothetical protein
VEPQQYGFGEGQVFCVDFLNSTLGSTLRASSESIHASEATKAADEDWKKARKLS